MDLDVVSVRNKRLKLFDSQSASTSPSTSMSGTPMSPVEDDEKFARALQAEIEREEKPSLKPPLPTTMNSWTMFASQNATNADSDATPKMQPGDDLSSQQSLPWSLTGMSNMPTSKVSAKSTAEEDLEYALKLQAQMDAEEYAEEYAENSDDSAYTPPPSVMNRLWANRRKRIPREVSVTEHQAHNLDMSADAVTVRMYAHSMPLIGCRRCHSARGFDQHKLLRQFNALSSRPEGSSITFLLVCETCGARTCMGCWHTLTTECLEYGALARDDSHLAWHCDAGRLALIWFLLCGYDNQARHNKNTTSSPAAKGALAPPKPKGRWFGRGGKAKSVPKGVGYAPDSDEYGEYDDYYYPSAHAAFVGQGVDLNGNITPPAGKEMAKDEVDPDDDLTAQSMTWLAAALPSPTSFVPTHFDADPPATLASMLLRSSILDKAAELLRNDSLEDATARCKLYQSLMHFLQVLAGGSRVTAKVLHTERAVNKAGHSLLKVSYNTPTRMKDEVVNTANPLALCLTNLSSQSAMMLKNAQSHQEMFEFEEGQQTLLLCNHIIECNAEIQDAAPRRTAKAKVQGPTVIDKAAWHKELAICEVSDDDILAVHYSSKQARSCKDPAQGRMRQLIKEVTNLQTSLPPGIFVRYGESRLDVMKCLIIGPNGTPYEHGLFEFDIFFPEKYPNEPPQMHIKTTGGGRVRFNPNLYADGKVCLSLLNTWAGQQWVPGQSTILQILVSIQAMVFCDEPHCNEPGFESEAGSEQSKDYNRNLYPNVIRYAMLEWLAGERSVTPTRPDFRALHKQQIQEMKDSQSTSHALLYGHDIKQLYGSDTAGLGHLIGAAPLVPGHIIGHGLQDPDTPGPGHLPGPVPSVPGHTFGHGAPMPGYVPNSNKPLKGHTPGVSAPMSGYVHMPGHLPGYKLPHGYMHGTDFSIPPDFVSKIAAFGHAYAGPPPKPGHVLGSNTPMSAPIPPSAYVPQPTAYPAYAAMPGSFPTDSVPGNGSQLPQPTNPNSSAMKDLLQAGKELTAAKNKAYKEMRQMAKPETTMDKGSIWAEVVKRHFEANEEEILQTVCRWIDDKHGPRSGHKRSRGRTLAEGSEEKDKSKEKRTGKKTALEDLKGQNLAARLEEALKEFPSSRMHPHLLSE